MKYIMAKSLFSLCFK